MNMRAIFRGIFGSTIIYFGGFYWAMQNLFFFLGGGWNGLGHMYDTLF